MRSISSEKLNMLLEAQDPIPCISLYQPTHRYHPDNAQDPIRYRHLLDEVRSSLERRYSLLQSDELMKRLESLQGRADFWNHRTDGLAIFCSSERFEVIDLQQSTEPLVIVADSFHVKPLLRSLQTADRFHVLCVNRREALLFEGNRYSLDPVDLAPEVRATITAALGTELTGPHQTVASYGGDSGGYGNATKSHGHGQKRDEIEVDLERFLRVIDRDILEHYSQPTGLPLVLAALPEYHATFRDVSHNPRLLENGIMKNPWALDREDLRKAAWEVFEPQYLQRLASLGELFRSANAHGLGSSDPAETARAATAGRVETLLVDSSTHIAGTLDRLTGEIEKRDLADPDVDDLLDDLSELVIRMKGDVVVLPPEAMPSATGVAAVFRY